MRVSGVTSSSNADIDFLVPQGLGRQTAEDWLRAIGTISARAEPRHSRDLPRRSEPGPHATRSGSVNGRIGLGSTGNIRRLPPIRSDTPYASRPSGGLPSKALHSANEDLSCHSDAIRIVPLHHARRSRQLRGKLLAAGPPPARQLTIRNGRCSPQWKVFTSFVGGPLATSRPAHDVNQITILDFYLTRRC